MAIAQVFPPSMIEKVCSTNARADWGTLCDASGANGSSLTKLADERVDRRSARATLMHRAVIEIEMARVFGLIDRIGFLG